MKHQEKETLTEKIVDSVNTVIGLIPEKLHLASKPTRKRKARSTLTAAKRAKNKVARKALQAGKATKRKLVKKAKVARKSVANRVGRRSKNQTSARAA